MALTDTHKQSLSQMLAAAKSSLGDLRSAAKPTGAFREAELKALVVEKRRTLPPERNTRLSDHQVREEVIPIWQTNAVQRVSRLKAEAAAAVAKIRPQLEAVRRQARRPLIPELAMTAADKDESLLLAPLRVDNRRVLQQQRRVELRLAFQQRPLKARMAALEAAEQEGDAVAADVLESMVAADLEDSPAPRMITDATPADVRVRREAADRLEQVQARRLTPEDLTQLAAWDTELQALDSEWSRTSDLVTAIEHVGQVTPATEPVGV